MSQLRGHDIHAFIQGGDALLKHFWEIEETIDE